MKAIAYLKGSSLSDPQAFYEVQRAEPQLDPHDLLVAVEAVSVNPLDTKVPQAGWRCRTLCTPWAGTPPGWSAR